MKYLKTFLESKTAPLLDLTDNQDKELLQRVASLARHKGKKILEIACGNGSDAIALYNAGFNVSATDSNKEYVDNINQNDKIDHSKLQAFVHDTRKSFPFTNDKFDLVFSRLGLHYFTESELTEIFKDIHRITKLYGYLVFTVKLSDDGKWGKKILATESWLALTYQSGFEIVSHEIKEGQLYGENNKWLEVVAIKENGRKNVDKKLESYFDVTWDFLSVVLTHFCDDHPMVINTVCFSIWNDADSTIWFEARGNELKEVTNNSGKYVDVPYFSKYNSDISSSLQNKSSHPMIEIIIEADLNYITSPNPLNNLWPNQLVRDLNQQFEDFEIPYEVVDIDNSSTEYEYILYAKHKKDIK